MKKISKPNEPQKDSKLVLLTSVLIIFLILLLGLLPNSLWLYWDPKADWSSISNYMSWRILALIVIASFLYVFEKPISTFIRNMVIKAKGIEISSQLPSIILTSETITGIEKVAHISSATQPTNQMFIDVIKESIEWQFRYANLFLMPATKNLLLWFANNNAITHQDFYRLWQHIPPNELQAELDALRAVKFIDDKNGYYILNNYGKAFMGLPLT